MGRSAVPPVQHVARCAAQHLYKLPARPRLPSSHCLTPCLPCPPQDVFVERHGVKLGFMSAFVKAAAQALQEIPAVNAVIDGDEIVYR